jgi:hypothetical protein
MRSASGVCGRRAGSAGGAGDGDGEVGNGGGGEVGSSEVDGDDRGDGGDSDAGSPATAIDGAAKRKTGAPRRACALVCSGS